MCLVPHKWVQRFLEQGIEGLTDKPGRGFRRMSRQPALTERHTRDGGERQHVAC